MTMHGTGTRQEWLKARLDLLKAEKEFTHRSDALARQRQELPWVRIDKAYKFDTDDGDATLTAPPRRGSSVTSANQVFSSSGFVR